MLLDRRLYLPEQSWLADRDRCAEAGVPPDITFKTRPEQVAEMLEATLEKKVPFAWFTADEEFGQNPGLRAYLETKDISYVMAVPKNTTFLDTAGERNPNRAMCSKTQDHTKAGNAAPLSVPKIFRVRLAPSNSLADPDHQYMIRRSIDDGELAYYHCYNPSQRIR